MNGVRQNRSCVARAVGVDGGESLERLYALTLLAQALRAGACSIRNTSRSAFQRDTGLGTPMRYKKPRRSCFQGD